MISISDVRISTLPIQTTEATSALIKPSNRTLRSGRASAKMPPMGFRVKVDNESPSTEPGIAALVTLVIENQDQINATYEVAVEGLDPGWVSLPVPTFQVAPGGTAEERVFLRPPREPDSLSGAYPFAVVVRSSSGDQFSVPMTLSVAPYHNISIDVQPKRGTVSTFSKRCTFHATVMNLGNVEHTLQLSASDADDLFVFEFEQEQVSVSPGAHKSVAITAEPKKPSLIANARLQQFAVSCRSLENKAVAGASHVQIEQRALITPSVIGLFALMLLIVTAFVIYLPKAPVVDTLTVTPERPVAGRAVTVNWTSSNSRSIRLEFNGKTYSDLDPNGSKTFMIEDPIDLSIKAWALSGRRSSKGTTRDVTVRPPEIVPEPVIEDFRVEPMELEIGQSFQVYYKLSDSVTSATLLPTGLNLDPRTEVVILTAQFVGEVDYKLVASNSAGQTTEKTIHVKTTQGSKASIVVFRAEPALVDPIDGRVTVTWQVSNAARIELVYDDATIILDQASGTGARDFVVNKDTTFKLVVYDEQGVTREKTVSIRIKTLDDFISGGGSTRNQ